MSDSGHAYVGFCPDCGAMVAATMEYTGKLASRTRKNVQEFMRDGLLVSRATDDEVRAKLHGCTAECPCKWCVKKRAKKAQTEAFSGSPASE